MEEKNIQEELNEEIELTEEVTEETQEEANEEVQEVDERDLKIEELTDSLQRLQAEYANYRRRTQQEKETIGVFANEKILNELIPVVDSMERALEACTDKEDTMYKGIDLVYKQLTATFEKFGLQEIEAENADFDPNLHLAVMQEAVDGVEANKVVMVLQKGYKLNTKVLRPSMVKVSC
ncbi:MAG: nucleotide exchange factor GrpE [Peptostreptococcaceae bacterium]|nr:nucleotide exchange factor GrpE [Peptostreptococcaceae bacterium]MBP3930029.1 nucleotide exchange factor GrpE [Peptostreptococcaceae bacterium]MBQ1793571.1 nucleotide exchange factor GrpE [Peptostreptococcaceae bacterium]